jgi:CRISPR-associated protein Cas5t
MRVLRLRLFQETACYRKSFAFKVGETYPLPPYSTVKGWLHALLDADRLIPMQISIQGSHEAKILDYQSYYFFKKHDTSEIPIILDGLVGIKHDFKDMTQMPIYVHLLYNIELLLHVACEEEILKQLIYRLKTTSIHHSLGRWEDLVRMDEYCLVELAELDSAKPITYDAYIPIEQIDAYYESKRFIPYRLNWTYEIRNGVRKWDTVDVGYISKGTDFREGEALVDEEGELAFLFPRVIG